jgi:mannose-6-phosphate isomerase
MANLYPLCFEPIFRRYLWGGRRLQSLLGKPIGEGDDYAESWEFVDHGADQSVVAKGPLQGVTLHDLVVQHGGELFGQHEPPEQFPLLFKFLDAHRNLSVQVHPDDAQAARLDPPDLGKTEAWVVLHADPGSLIYAGLRPGVDRSVLEQRIAAGETESCLHRFEPKAGDCVFIPAGTVHALGAGLVVAEIQQASDTTLRLFDWNRVGPDGRPRPLHVEAALEVIDFQRGPVTPQVPETTSLPHVERLVACDKFILDRWHIQTGEQMVGGDGRLHVVVVVQGVIDLQGGSASQPLVKGQTILLPAATGPCSVRPHGVVVLLDIYLPPA